jgi:hypothetical protein
MQRRDDCFAGMIVQVDQRGADVRCRAALSERETQSDFERAYLGKSKDGKPKRRVNVSSASRLMIALGRAPNELSGC